jgi:hypothetical protein
VKILGGIILVILIFAFLGSMDIRREKEGAKENVPAVAAICKSAESKVDMAKVRKEYIYKIESNYLVYVKPTWYFLSLDSKKGLAGYLAECSLGGSARFLDYRTGKLLARWGPNGYVNYED